MFAGDIEPSLQGCPGEPQTQLATVRPIVVDITVPDAHPNVTVVAEYEQGQYEGKTCTLSVFVKQYLEDISPFCRATDTAVFLEL